jgi:hypothetical protein
MPLSITLHPFGASGKSFEQKIYFQLSNFRQLMIITSILVSAQQVAWLGFPPHFFHKSSYPMDSSISITCVFGFSQPLLTLDIQHLTQTK